MVGYSLEQRRWIWDIHAINRQIFSNGVAQLLTTSINRLPLQVVQTSIVASTLSQIDDATIDILSDGQQLLPFNMKDALQILIKMGIMEKDKASSSYRFTHDLMQQVSPCTSVP